MRLYLVRHAQSEANAGLPGATRDSRLTELGRRQAEAVAQRLAHHRIGRVLASPYVRTLETAEAIRLATGAPATVLPLLHEHQVRPFEVDDWPLLSRAALGERYPDFALPPDFAFGPRWHDAPETEAGVLRRAGQVVLELWHTYAAAPDGDQEVRLVVVSHGSPTAKLVLAALGLAMPPGIDVQLRINNASISTVEYSPPSRLLLGLNRVEHLEPLRVDWPAADPGYLRRP
ncbi:MAG TPA: histidine phosphatase family protein [Chloroflexota bacterium]|nr:histidine phosphatase family protein [Chloroflexota bacterium]